MRDRDLVFAELGIDPVWRLRGAPATPAAVPAAGDPLVQAESAAALDWDALESAVAACTRCRLAQSRTQGVLGVGDRQADWMFVGEAPGAEEDRRGEPFVGAAGRLLDAMLASIGLARAQGVYIANVLKSRPPGNRDPEADEIAACMPYLVRQIELVSPRIIVALGRFAAQTLLATDAPLGKLRGQVHHYREIPLVVTYHPAYLLRNLPDKARAWEDLCLARRIAMAP